MTVKTNNTGEAKKVVDEAKTKAKNKARNRAKYLRAFDKMEDSIKVTHETLKGMKSDSTVIINGSKVFFYKGFYYILEPQEDATCSWISYDGYPKKRLVNLVAELAL